MTTEEKMRQVMASAVLDVSDADGFDRSDFPTGLCAASEFSACDKGRCPPPCINYNYCRFQPSVATEIDCMQASSGDYNLCPCSAGTVERPCSGTNVSNTCTVACEVGWNQNPQFRQLRCEADGNGTVQFNSSTLDLECKQVVCNDKHKVEFAHTTESKDTHHPCNASLSFGESCKAQCEPGYFGAPDVTATCNATADGKPSVVYQPHGQDPPTKKPAGTCKACPVGHYKESPGHTNCTECGEGRFNPDQAKKSKTDCLACPTGQYSDRKGRGTKDCDKCETNRYQDKTGMKFCYNCTANSVTEGKGKKNQDDCLCTAGYYAHSGDPECTPCRIGSFKNETGTRASNCQQCGTHSDTLGRLGQGYCVCEPGFGKFPWTPKINKCEAAPCPSINENWNGKPTPFRAIPPGAQPIGNVCGDKAVVNKTCVVDCGQLDPTQVKSTPVNYTCTTRDNRQDETRANASQWREMDRAIQQHGRINCSALADCHDFADCNNFGDVSKSLTCHQYAQIFVDQTARKGSQDGQKIGTTRGVGWRLCSGYVGKTCATECWESFYSKHQQTTSGYSNQTYSCTPGNADGGVWRPIDDGKPLVCEPGRLSVSHSNLLAEKAKVVSQQRAYKQPISTLQGSLFLGSGPTYSFDVQAMDMYNKPRNYTQLNLASKTEAKWKLKYRDYMVAVFRRVPVDLLPTGQRMYQPRNDYIEAKYFEQEMTWCMDDMECDGKSKNMECDCKSKNYDEGKKIPLTDSPRCDIKLPADELAGNIWRITHQFAEHGVFYLSVFMCDYETGMDDCDKHAFSTLVNGTFDFDNETQKQQANPDKFENYLKERHAAFTVCPAGTKGPDNVVGGGGVFWGAGLSECRAIGGQVGEGFFNPYGTGRISALCPDGFLCRNDGATWPIAMPGYWVSNYLSPYLPVMKQCDVVGACPGSYLFQPLSNSLDWKHKCSTTVMTDHNFLNFSHDITYADSNCFHIPRHMHDRLPNECLTIVGAQCCPGNFGPACASCCKPEESTAELSCKEGAQWHAVTTISDKQCVKCPASDQASAGTYIAVVAVLIITAPLTSKLSNFFDHARSIQGPLLSIVNFCQSSNLFLGLKFRWPPEFVYLARTVGSWLNFNLSGLLQVLNSLLARFHTKLTVPNPDCVVHLSYPTKWHLTMASPFLVAITVVIYSCITSCLRLIWNRVRVRSGTISGHLEARLPKLLDDHDEDGSHYTNSFETEPEPEPALRGRMDSVSRPASPDHSRWTDPAGEDSFTTLGRGGSSRPASPIQRTGLSEYSQDWVAFQHASSQAPQVQLTLDSRLQGGSKIETATCSDLISAPKMWINVQKAVLGYLMIGYVFLAGTALEPLACLTNVDGKSYMRNEPEIQCTWCKDNASEIVVWSTASDAQGTNHTEPKSKTMYYTTLRTEAIIWSTLYGIGSPLLFFVVLYSHRDVLKKNEFQNGFGFLSTKMREEYYFWEVMISGPYCTFRQVNM